MTNQLTEFYLNDGLDNFGRTFIDIINFPDEEISKCHDFIQWIFPTKTSSSYNSSAPILDDESIKIFKDNPTATRVRLYTSLSRYFKFLGIDYYFDADGILIVNTIKLDEKYEFWKQLNDHNLLRLSRVMECCNLMGYHTTAESLFHILLATSTVSDFITPTNIYYWYKSTFNANI